MSCFYWYRGVLNGNGAKVTFGWGYGFDVLLASELPTIPGNKTLQQPLPQGSQFFDHPPVIRAVVAQGIRALA